MYIYIDSLRLCVAVGTHVTPNLPSFRSVDWSLLDARGWPGDTWGEPGAALGNFAGESLASAKGAAEALAFQQEAAVALVAGFVEAEMCRIEGQRG